MFPGCVFSLRGDVGWPVQSPILSVCDLFLKNYLKFYPNLTSFVPHTLAELRDRITEEVNTILRHIKLNAVIQHFRKRFNKMLILADIFLDLMNISNLYGYLLMNLNIKLK